MPKITQKDTAPLRGQVNANLTGASAELHIMKPDGTVLSKAAVVESAGDAGSIWRYDWLADELTPAGRWYVEVEVTFGGGKVQTFGPEEFWVDEEFA